MARKCVEVKKKKGGGSKERLGKGRKGGREKIRWKEDILE